MSACARAAFSYPINKSKLVKVDPARHEGVPQPHQLRLVAHHELLGCHLGERLAVRQPDQVVETKAREHALLGDDVGYAL